MNMRSRQLLAILGGVLTVVSASATERYFTYSYEPETMPRGGWEGEQWATPLAGRNAAAGQEDFQQWEIRHGLGYRGTDKFSTVVSGNAAQTHLQEPAT